MIFLKSYCKAYFCLYLRGNVQITNCISCYVSHLTLTNAAVTANLMKKRHSAIENRRV